MGTTSTRAAAATDNRGRSIYIPEIEWLDIKRYAHLETRSASGFIREACKARCRQIAMSHMVEGLRGR